MKEFKSTDELFERWLEYYLIPEDMWEKYGLRIDMLKECLFEKNGTAFWNYERAFRAVLDHCKYFPTVKELRDSMHTYWKEHQHDKKGD